MGIHRIYFTGDIQKGKTNAYRIRKRRSRGGNLDITFIVTMDKATEEYGQSIPGFNSAILFPFGKLLSAGGSWYKGLAIKYAGHSEFISES